MIVRFICGVVIAVSLCAACASDGAGDQTDKAQAEQPEFPYPPLPADVRQRLWESSDYVDIIFYNSPISVSQNDAPAIRSTLGMTTGQPALPNPACKPQGRISYMIQGDIAVEADFFTTEQCQYFLFLENGKPAYAETLSPAGINFFNQIQEQFRNAVQ